MAIGDAIPKTFLKNILTIPSPSVIILLFRKEPTEYGGIPEWPKGADCKSVVSDFGGSNPPSPTMKETSFVYQERFVK